MTMKGLKTSMKTTLRKRSKETKNNNTTKSDKKCEKIFMKYLKSTGNDIKYWLYDPEDLDKQLGTFWFAVRNNTGL